MATALKGLSTASYNIPPPAYNPSYNPRRETEDVIFIDSNQPLLDDTNENRYGTIRNIPHVESDTNFGFDSKSIRRGFIRKVFGILTVQLAIVAAMVALFLFQKDVKYFVQTSPWFYILSYVIFIITYFALALGTNVRRRFPGNMGCLLLLTFSMGYILASIASFHDVKEILIALIITVVACLLIVAFTLQPKYDFVGCLGLAYVFTSAFFIFAIITLIVTLIFYQPILYLIYTGFAAILFMMYLSIDVYMIVGGKRPEISPEDYTFAAVQVFLDIVNIFMLILILIDRR